ncbi:MAG: ABC transporter ATP-binding protein [Candidatus Levybacteria bacterium]|nr:ABC transporter ATP-binding protein [Candidatus Levybacteria bacterium]
MPKKIPLIELSNIVKEYPIGDNEVYRALDGIDLTIHEGEFVAIMGPSGSGKSTLMHILGALDIPTKGNFILKKKNISSYTEDQLAEIRNREIGFVFQSFNLLPRTTVQKNVEKPMIYAGISQKERTERALAALEKVGIAEKAGNLSNRISGGQIQRVAIARALVMNPSIILADEPTGNLDSKTSHEIMKFIEELNNDGKTIIIITHEHDIAAFAKRVIKLVDGKIVSDRENGKKLNGI